MRRTPSELYASMAVLPPPFSVAEAEALARERWGFDGRAEVLHGERDRNFRLRGADGRNAMLRIANPVEDPAFRAMQSAALRHIARTDPDLPVPRLVALPDGADEAAVPHGGETLHARMLTWLDGVVLHESRRSPAQSAAHGAALARLQLALRDFSHPGAVHEVAWDLMHAPRLREIAFTIQYPEARDVLDALLDEYDREVTPMLPRLRRQIVHNDLTRKNVLVDAADNDRIAGLIDFGDLADTAVVFDVAIGALSQSGAGMATDVAIGHFVRGFHAVRPLLAEEVAIMPLLMGLRLAMGIALSSWHRHSQPDNPHYLRSRESIFAGLALIGELRAPPVAAALRRATGSA